MTWTYLECTVHSLKSRQGGAVKPKTSMPNHYGCAKSVKNSGFGFLKTHQTHVKF